MASPPEKTKVEVGGKEVKQQSSSNGEVAASPQNETSSTAATVSIQHPSDTPPRIVLKSGVMRKQNRKKHLSTKFFVLVKDTSSGIVWLEYFDNEKAYRTNPAKAKRTINITQSFSVNRRPTSTNTTSNKNKQGFGISIFTWEDIFNLFLDDEQEMKEWLDAMVNQKASSIREVKSNGITERLFNETYDYVWQVCIVKEGLAMKNEIFGLFRICLTPRTLQVYKVDSTLTTAPKPLEFPLNIIRRVGHSKHEKHFVLELGRSSSIGAGNLFMQTEDLVSAQQMHEIIREAMIKCESSALPVIRPRSSSTSDGGSAAGRTRRSSFQSQHPNRSSHSHTLSSSHNASTESTVATTTSGELPSSSATVIPSSTSATSMSGLIRDRCDSLPSKSRWANESTSTAQGGVIYTDVSIGPKTYRTHHKFPSTSPPSLNPLSPTSDSTESVGSSLSDGNDYMCMHENPISHGSVPYGVPTQPSIQEEDSNEGYLPMTFRGTTSATSTSEESTGTVTQEADEGYLNMAPVSITEGHHRGGTSRRSGHGSPSPPRQSREKLCAEFPLAPVKSFFGPEEDNVDAIKPVRAYSIGSRPLTSVKFGPGFAGNRLARLPTSKEETPLATGGTPSENPDLYRVRAHSTGSHGTAALRGRGGTSDPNIGRSLHSRD